MFNQEVTENAPVDLDQVITGSGTPLAMQSSLITPPTETLKSDGLKTHFDGTCQKKKLLNIQLSVKGLID